MTEKRMTESWGMGWLATGARGATGPTGEERQRLDAARPEVMRAIQESFAQSALHLTNEAIPQRPGIGKYSAAARLSVE